MSETVKQWTLTAEGTLHGHAGCLCPAFVVTDVRRKGGASSHEPSGRLALTGHQGHVTETGTDEASGEKPGSLDGQGRGLVPLPVTHSPLNTQAPSKHFPG